MKLTKKELEDIKQKSWDNGLLTGLVVVGLTAIIIVIVYV